MKREEIEAKVKEVLKQQLGVKDEQIADESKKLVEDLGADSLDQVELLMALEEVFEVDVSDEDAEKLRTIKDIVDYADKVLN